MNINDEIRVILSGKPVPKKNCPYCGKPLEIVINGYPSEEIEDFMQKNPDYFAYGGCCVFGDDRDPSYYCSGCNKELSYNLKPIALTYCPLVSSGYIHKEECRQYSILAAKNRYTLIKYKKLVCDKICPSIGRRVSIVKKDGSVNEGMNGGVKLAAPDSPGSFLGLEISREDGSTFGAF